MGLKKTVRDFLVVVMPNLVEEPEQILTAPKWDTLAAITLSAAGKSLPEELKLILTYLHLGEALWHYLLINEDRWDVGAADKAPKATELKEALVMLCLAKMAPTEQS